MQCFHTIAVMGKLRVIPKAECVFSEHFLRFMIHICTQEKEQERVKHKRWCSNGETAVPYMLSCQSAAETTVESR